MNKLMSSHLARLRKDKVFWLCMASVLVYAVACMLNGCGQASVDMSEYNYTLDKFYFHFALSIGAFISVFSSMFLGTEYSDGTIRNKIVVGHTRTEIYLSNLLLTFTASMLMMLVWIVGAMVGIPFLGFWNMGAGQLLTYLLIAVLFTAALCAVFTMIGSLSENKTVGAVVSLLLFLGLLILASIIQNILNEPEMTSGVIITADGMDLSEPTPNPNYVSGTARAVLAFILDLLPTGQGIQMAFLEIVTPMRMILSSVFMTVSVTVCGLFFFRKKDLK